MYLVTINSFDGTESVLHDSRDRETILINPVLTLEVNKSGTFTFDIFPNHPNTDKILKMSSEISIYQDGKPIYIGRPLEDAGNMQGISTITCEGILAYLLDSQVRPYEYTGSIRGMLEQFINSHNAQVEVRKRFILGDVTVVDDNNYINRSNSSYSSTLSAINEKLIKTHGGYLRIRYETDGRYLDYLADYGHINSQVIEFGENLLDLNQFIMPDGLITAIIPIGAQTEEDGINGTKKRVDITSVNDGKDYLIDADAVSQFGYIFDTVKFEDVTLPANLKKKGQAYLEEHCNLVHSIELAAIDLHLIDVDTEKISLGDWVRIKSIPHKLNKLFPVTRQSLHLTDPASNSIVLGKTLGTFTSDSHKVQGEITDYVIQTAKETSTALMSAVENATKLITGGLGGYVVIDRAEDGHPQAILFMDHPDKEDARNILQINKNGIGFSRSGINGPYQNAWTIDGKFVADFITTGTLNADLIKAGKLSSRNGASEIDMDTGIANLAGSYIVSNPNSGDQIGGIRWDTSGAGTEDEAQNRMFLYTVGSYAMKILSNYRLSIEGSDLVYIAGGRKVEINAGGTRWKFASNGIYCNDVLAVPVPN